MIHSREKRMERNAHPNRFPWRLLALGCAWDDMIADAVAIIGTMDIVFGDIDR